MYDQPINEKIKMTKEGYERLLKKLRELKEDKLPGVIKRISEAKKLGDLSENAEYKSALEDRELIMAQIKEIENMIDKIEVVDVTVDKDKSKIVKFGSKVVVEMTDSGEVFTFQIVHPGEIKIPIEEGDEDILYISFDSPVGGAVEGKKPGDIVEYRIFTGIEYLERSLKILKIY